MVTLVPSWTKPKESLHVQLSPPVTYLGDEVVLRQESLLSCAWNYAPLKPVVCSTIGMN